MFMNNSWSELSIILIFKEEVRHEKLNTGTFDEDDGRHLGW